MIAIAAATARWSLMLLLLLRSITTVQVGVEANDNWHTAYADGYILKTLKCKERPKRFWPHSDYKLPVYKPTSFKIIAQSEILTDYCDMLPLFGLG